MYSSALLVLLAGCKPDLDGGPPDPAPEIEHGDSSSTTTDADRDGFELPEDCDDSNAAVNPAATETCNDADDDCDGNVDEEATDARLAYPDLDGDGYGAAAPTVTACDLPIGYAVMPDDCDDTNADANPGLSERCATSWDDDCDGLINDAASTDVGSWWPDADGDGYGDGDVAAFAACMASDSQVDNGADCNDTDDAIRPSARDVCNDGLDQDCDGSARECPFAGALTVGEADATLSGDGYFTPMGTLAAADADGDGRTDLLLSGYGDDLVAIFTAARTLSGNVQLGADTIWIHGTGDGQEVWGSGLGGGGDLDGDGVGDILVAAENESTTAHAAGAVDVFRGPVTDGIAHADAYATLYGEGYADRLTLSLLTPDIDGDGIAELVAGTSVQADEKGAVYIVWGPIPAGALLAGQADVRLRGDAGSCFGLDSSAADLDGDGRLDLAVGAVIDEARAGAVHLFSGAGLVAAPSEGHEADAKIIGDGGSFGQRVDARGDHDGSGAPDLLVAAPLHGSGFDVPGRTYVFTDPGLTATTALDADVVLTGPGTQGYDGTARWLGDVNGDHYDDLLIAEGDIPEGGVAYLFYGPVSGDLTWHANADATIEGAPADSLGGNFAAKAPDYRVGDLDGDGFAEFVLPGFGTASNGNGGNIYLFRGAAAP